MDWVTTIQTALCIETFRVIVKTGQKLQLPTTRLALLMGLYKVWFFLVIRIVARSDSLYWEPSMFQLMHLQKLTAACTKPKD
jgi:hypothetical protein